MIAKRIERKANSSFKKLADYIVRENGVGDVLMKWATNTVSEDHYWAVAEIDLVQGQNHRSKADKTYHLIISLAPGEKLSESEFKLLESNLCKTLGLEDHQRLAAVHSDSACMHMHLAINLVHPDRKTIQTPWHEYPKLQAFCRDHEKHFGFAPGISMEKEKKREIKSEIYRGVQGFESFVRDTLKLDIQRELKLEKPSWDAIQKICGYHNVEIKKQGAGLVFSDKKSALTVKCSTIDRHFSLKSLESRLGEFCHGPQMPNFNSGYKANQPAKNMVPKKMLYDSYLKYRKNLNELRRQKPDLKINGWHAFLLDEAHAGNRHATNLIKNHSEIYSRYQKKKEEILLSNFTEGQKKMLLNVQEKHKSEEIKKTLASEHSRSPYARPSIHGSGSEMDKREEIERGRDRGFSF